ncbi:MAG TPA: zf-HC2 domain-containing protein [Pyrinomonadaceae bacterium]|nr:zf-HC2 domain-containing protein [Pyrinomonadaceae bacterium]
MKCELCLELLEEYLDGELAERVSSEVAAHLVTCSRCLTESSVLAAEEEMFSRYDRELEVPASLWGQIAERTVVTQLPKNGFGARFVSLFRVPSFGFALATAVALIVIGLVVGSTYIRSRKSDPKHTTVIGAPTPSSVASRKDEQQQNDVTRPANVFASHDKSKTRRSPAPKRTPIDQSDVLSSDFGYQDPDDKDTAKHIEQTQNLLRSIRNVQVNDGDHEIDVTYDKALSRRLLNENIVLRRDAEMKAKFPTKSLLSDLEPFLIDIANLPDQARPEDIRAIKERVQKTEIVAALIGY